MDVSIIETSGLGDRSYLVAHHGIAVVIDPQRDIDRVLALADKNQVRITHVLETHLHNDYVTGDWNSPAPSAPTMQCPQATTSTMPAALSSTATSSTQDQFTSK